MGNFLVVKVKDYKSSRNIEYKNEINLQDPNLVLQVFLDLESFGLPLRKVIQKYLDTQKAFPI